MKLDTIHNIDCLEGLRQMPDDYVDCVMTSIPYWGLRDYGVAGQFGLEPTLDEYISNMTEVFREVRRVLKPTGTLWLNMGDAYAGGQSHTTDGTGIQRPCFKELNKQKIKRPDYSKCGLKTKDLVGMPWRLAFALQADGWYLRSDIIWAKPNPMPESVTDRPTKAHEYLFLFAKGEWSSRVIKFSDFYSERFHLGKNLRFDCSTMGLPTRLAVDLATTIFNNAEVEEKFSLPPFYSQVWEQLPDGRDSDFVSSLPEKHRFTVWAARFLTANTTTKEFMEKLNSIWHTLSDSSNFLKRWTTSDIANSPSITSNRKGTITIHYSSEICEVDFIHSKVIISRPRKCVYYYDADAIREPNVRLWDESNAGSLDIKGKHKLYGKEREKHTTKYPLPNPLGRNRRTVWTIATQPYPEAHFACVDEETECLTIDGWKIVHELTKKDRLACYDLQGEWATWSPLLDLYKNQVENLEMIKIVGRGIDQLLTKDHRCVIKTRAKNKNKIIEAQNLKSYQRCLIVPETWETEKVDFPARLARLIGWYITEGSEGKDSITLYQSFTANPEYCNEIEQLLLDEGAEFKKYVRNRNWLDKEYIAITWRITGAIANILLSLCPKKTFPKGFLQWENESLWALWDALMKGDGNFREGGRQSFVQKDKKIIDNVQALAVKLGYATTIRKRSAFTWALYKTSAKTRWLHKANGSLIGVQKYSGLIWCPQTEKGTWIARRNGRVFITGNTFPEKLVEPCILAGTSERGNCAECGKPWVRVVEMTDEYKELLKSGKAWQTNEGKPDKYTNRQEKGHPSNVPPKNKTIGWQPSCSCDADIERPIVLDPFMGSGTVALVAARYNRHFIGFELNKEYCELARKRVANELAQKKLF